MGMLSICKGCDILICIQSSKLFLIKKGGLGLCVFLMRSLDSDFVFTIYLFEVMVIGLQRGISGNVS